eukprot:GHVH01014104.1.p1 GENE.GHVH01014104.1~~GHVH01014104.1.p1  ORF type:complete len:467 (+),score=65.53 GHVH01014104.1:568-1968(+)
MILKKKPVYLGIPIDICGELISDRPAEYSASLHPGQETLMINQDFAHPTADEQSIDIVVDRVLNILQTCDGASCGAVAVGSLLKRCADSSALSLALRLVDILNLPTLSFPDDRCVLNEGDPKFMGVLSNAIPDELSFACDRYHKGFIPPLSILTIGVLMTDISPGFREVIDNCIKIDLMKVVIGAEVYRGMPMVVVLNKMIEKASTHRNPFARRLLARDESPSCHQPSSNDHTDKNRYGLSEFRHHAKTTLMSNIPPNAGPIGFPNITTSMAEHLEDGDTLFADIGTITMAIMVQPLYKKISFEQQTLWCSIGFSTPGGFGAAVAKRAVEGRLCGRTVVITGEGSHLMTIQNLVCYLHEDLGPVTIINIDNGGYTIEKLLTVTPLKLNSIYNDLPTVNFPMIARGFGGNRILDNTKWIIHESSTVEDMIMQLNEAKSTKRSLYLTIKIEEDCAPEPAKRLIETMYK